jgi:hypothetical protein
MGSTVRSRGAQVDDAQSVTERGGGRLRSR